MVRSSALSVWMLCLLLTGCWKEPAKFNWKNAPGAEQYERLMWQAIHDKEWNELEYHLAPDFVGVNATGQTLDRTAWVEYCKGLQGTGFSLGGLKVEPNGPDMVVTDTLHMSTTAFSGDVQVVSVWQQVKRGWLLITQSLTPISTAIGK
jgi:Domain of unknown function (DUF4440)